MKPRPQINKLMIHNIQKEFFDLDLSGFQLTFDDGLYSQYYYSPLFQPNDCHRIYFIITGLIQMGKARKTFDGQYLPYLKSSKYMHEAFIKRNFDQFMRLEELEDIANQKEVTIGAHSHFHDIILTEHRIKKPLSQWKLALLPCALRNNDGSCTNRRSKLAYPGYLCSGGKLVKRSKTKWLDYIKYDTETCLEWFEKHLRFQPSIYCFPFNEYTPVMVEILKSYGFSYFYNGSSGDNKQIFSRIDIDKLTSKSDQVPL
jgi:hypothetical protein